MTIEARRQYLAAVRLRYKNGTKTQKSRILDEFCQVCNYNRKHAIRLLKGEPAQGKDKPGPKPTYDALVVEHLVALWKLMNYMCGIRMKEALQLWLDYYEAK